MIRKKSVRIDDVKLKAGADDSSSDKFCIKDGELAVVRSYKLYTIKQLEESQTPDGPLLRVELVPGEGIGEQRVSCSICGSEFQLKKVVRNGYTSVTLKDDMMLDHFVLCAVRQPRITCPHCGRMITVTPEFKHPGHNVTLRLCSTIKALLAQGLFCNQIKQRTRVHPAIINELAKAVFEEGQAAP